MKTKYDKYWYFRTVADEDDDDDVQRSITIPVAHITSMYPNSATSIVIRFKQPTSELPPSEIASNKFGRVTLTTADQANRRELMQLLVSTMTSSDRDNPTGITVIADDTTTDYDGSTRSAKYISPTITACGGIVAR
jgi:hypothetical protein